MYLPLRFGLIQNERILISLITSRLRPTTDCARLNESPALRDAYAGSHCCRCFQLDDKPAVPADC